ncbi:MAG: hypothetical protein LBN04_09595 [Oscillospiraceae bacterium]|jgi:hypothetical protein|nr:hypothetical protein [Oscillospiraceae bacterium]
MSKKRKRNALTPKAQAERAAGLRMAFREEEAWRMEDMMQGVITPRCTICGGRLNHPVLRRCPYCGKAGGGGHANTGMCEAAAAASAE